MKTGNRAAVYLFLALWLAGCANRPQVTPVLDLSTETSLPVFTPTIPAAPAEAVSLTNTPELHEKERLSQLPPLSLPEFNARYSTGDIALSANGQYLAVISQDKSDATQSVWFLEVDDLDRSSFGYQIDVERLWSVSFSPDGNLLAIGGTGTIIIFDWRTGDIVNKINIPDVEPVQLAFGKNNSIVWSAFNDKVTVWDLSGGEVKYSVEGITGHEPNSFAISPNGRVLVTGDYGGINLWDFDTGQNLGFREGPEGGIGVAPSIAFSSTGQFLAATGCSEIDFESCSVGNVMIWKSEFTNPSMRFDVHFGWIKVLAFSPDESMLVSSSGDGRVELINLSDGKMMTVPSLEILGQLPPDDQLLIKDIAFFPTGRILAVSTSDGIQLLDVSTMFWMPYLRFILSLNYSYAITAEGDNLNFRTEPSTHGEILKRLHKGEWFTVIDGPKVVDYQVWWKVKIEDETAGWIVEMPGWYEFVP